MSKGKKGKKKDEPVKGKSAKPKAGQLAKTNSDLQKVEKLTKEDAEVTKAVQPVIKQSEAEKTTTTKTIVSWGAIGAALIVIFDFLGRVVTGLDFLQYLFKWRTHLLNFIVLVGLIAGLILGYVAWQLFQRANRYRYIFSTGAVALVAIVLIGWIYYVQTREEKLIVLVTKFDDTTGDYYELRNEIFDKLNDDYKMEETVQIEKIDEVITEDATSGSARARDLGKNYQADLVIWGSYRKTENPNMKIHVENLSANQFIFIKESDTLEPSLKLSELESFTFQQQAGHEASALISFLAGFVDYMASNYESAITRFDKALANPSSQQWLLENYNDVYFYRGTTNLYLKDYQRAIQDFNQILEPESNFIEAYNNRGLAYFYLGDIERAIQDYNLALEVEPNFAEAYNNLGNAYADLEDNQQAIQNLNIYIEKEPNEESGYYNRGLVYVRQNEYVRAFQDFEKAIEKNPDSSASYNARGVVYKTINDYDHALQDYEKAIELDPTSAIPYYNRGIAYSELKDFHSAIQNFDKAIELNPNYVAAYYNRGTAYGILENYERAIQDFDQAILLDPNLDVAYHNRGYAYAALQNYERAIQEYDQALFLNPNNVNAYYNRGIAYQKLGRTTEAESDFAKYTELTGQPAP